MAHSTFRERLSTKLFWAAAVLTSLLGGGFTLRTQERNPSVRHEETDINTRAVMITAGAVLFSLWMISFLLIFVFHHFRDIHQSARPSPQSHQVELPPEPRLQESPRLDLKQLQDEAETRLNSYRWVDRQKGVVAIPIERAMELTAQRGIPPVKGAGNAYFQPRQGSPNTGFEAREGASR